MERVNQLVNLFRGTCVMNAEEDSMNGALSTEVSSESGNSSAVGSPSGKLKSSIASLAPEVIVGFRFLIFRSLAAMGLAPLTSGEVVI